MFSRIRVVWLTVIPLKAQETPIGPKWWPSEWGPEDQRGPINRITPRKVLQAAGLVKEGKIYQLGFPDVGTLDE